MLQKEDTVQLSFQTRSTASEEKPCPECWVLCLCFEGKRWWRRDGELVWVESPNSNNARLVGGLGRFRDFCTDFSVSKAYSMAQR